MYLGMFNAKQSWHSDSIQACTQSRHNIAPCARQLHTTRRLQSTWSEQLCVFKCCIRGLTLGKGGFEIVALGFEVVNVPRI